jgi:hypothetical protein
MKLSLLALIFLSFAQQALATPQIVALCKFSEDLGGRTSTDESYISWHLGNPQIRSSLRLCITLRKSPNRPWTQRIFSTFNLPTKRKELRKSTI